VIIKTNKRERPVTSVLQFAASLAAYFSRSSEALKVDVDYTKRKYVRGIPGTTAEVTYSNARTIRVSPSLWKELVKES
jgi:predicted ribosome quality control (RQC) complex YloA/Tae2 family protein